MKNSNTNNLSEKNTSFGCSVLSLEGRNLKPVFVPILWEKKKWPSCQKTPLVLVFKRTWTSYDKLSRHTAFPQGRECLAQHVHILTSKALLPPIGWTRNCSKYNVPLLSKKKKKPEKNSVIQNHRDFHPVSHLWSQNYFRLHFS